MKTKKENLTKNTKFNAEICDINDDGDGVAKIEGKIVFVPNALPDEVVEGTIIYDKSKYSVGKVLKYLKKSEKRIEPECPYFSSCGGCNLQHMPYDCQLDFKTKKVQKALQKELKCNFTQELVVMPCVKSKPYFYRNKIALPVDQSGKLGLFRNNTHKVLPIQNCLINEEWVENIIKAAESYIKVSNITIYDESLNKGLLRHVVARRVGKNIIITFVINGDALPYKEYAVSEFSKYFANFSLNFNINKTNSNLIMTDKFVNIYGSLSAQNESEGIVYEVQNGSFYQVNDEIREKIYHLVKSRINKEDIVIECYSGAGVLSAIISKVCKFCYGIEIVKSATQDADKLKKTNNINNLKNINGDCAKVLPKLFEEIDAKNKQTTIVVDPPRKGLDAKVAESILSVKPNKIIYISCNPSTLARDLKIFAKDYNISFVQPFDMFPQTAHVETVVELVKI